MKKMCFAKFTAKKRLNIPCTNDDNAILSSISLNREILLKVQTNEKCNTGPGEDYTLAVTRSAWRT